MRSVASETSATSPRSRRSSPTRSAHKARFDEAEDFCRIAERIGAEDDLATQVLWRSAMAKIWASRSEHAEAVALARAAVEMAERTDGTIMLADAIMDLAEVLSAAGDSIDVTDTRRRAEELYLAKGSAVSATRAAQLLPERADQWVCADLIEEGPDR